jgi:hypothetical protein
VRSVSKRLVVFAGLLAAPAATQIGEHTAVPPTRSNSPDPRLVRLRQFFSERDCPITKYAADFIQAADTHALDWRLLPSISVVESGGGKAFMNNNVFGWDSCRVRFPSIRAGIHIVASRLANSRLYRDKSLDEMLRTYNPNLEYPTRVKYVMRALGARELETTVN